MGHKIHFCRALSMKSVKDLKIYHLPSEPRKPLTPPGPVLTLGSVQAPRPQVSSVTGTPGGETKRSSHQPGSCCSAEGPRSWDGSGPAGPGP